MTIKAAQLRNWITIQQRVTTQDAMGGPTNSFTNWNQVWARIIAKGGSEQFRGDQFSPEVTHQVHTRWLDGISPMMRILTEDGKIFDILYVNYSERRIDDEVMMMCKERIGQSGDVNVG